MAGVAEDWMGDLGSAHIEHLPLAGGSAHAVSAAGSGRTTDTSAPGTTRHLHSPHTRPFSKFHPPQTFQVHLSQLLASPIHSLYTCNL